MMRLYILFFLSFISVSAFEELEDPLELVEDSTQVLLDIDSTATMGMVLQDSVGLEESVPQNIEEEGTIIIYQDAELSMLLEKERELSSFFNKTQKRAIQVASGNHLKYVREKCDESKEVMGIDCEIKYESPNYKCWCGHYTDDLTAERSLEKFKIEFPNALLINIK